MCANLTIKLSLLRFRRYYRYVLTLKCLKPSKRDAPTGMFLASAFGLQVAAQLAYGAPAHGCPHRGLQRGRSMEDTNALTRANTIQYEGAGAMPSARRHVYANPELTTQQRMHQSVYEAPHKR